MEWSSATGDPLVYWFFYVLLVAILTYCGYGMGYKNERDWKKYAKFAVISFALIEGLRWLRGADYYQYYLFFESGKSIDGGKGRDYEPLFGFFARIFPTFHIYPSIAFIILSGFLCSGNVALYSNYKKAAVIGLPIMFLLYGSSSAENIVRQYCAASFLMFAYYFYVTDNKMSMLITLACIPFVHFSGLFGVVAFLALTYKKIPFKYPLLFVGIYAFLYFFWDSQWLELVVDYLSTINLGTGEENNGQFYLDNADRWFTEEGSMSKILGTEYHMSLISQVVNFLTEISLVYFGFLACEKDQKLHVVYYFAFLGIIIKLIAGDIEIISRFALWLNWMVPVVAGLIFCNIDFDKRSWLKLTLTVIFAAKFIFYGLIRAFGSIPYAGCGFIWDK